MKDIIMLGLGLAIGAFFLIAALNLGLAPTIGNKLNVTNSTFVSYTINDTALATNFSTFSLGSYDSGYSALGTVTWQQYGSDYLNVTTDDGTVLTKATASPATFNLTGAQLATTLTLNFSSNSTHVKHASNVTSTQIDYRLVPTSTTQG